MVTNATIACNRPDTVSSKNELLYLSMIEKEGVAIIKALDLAIKLAYCYE